MLPAVEMGTSDWRAQPSTPVELDGAALRREARNVVRNFLQVAGGEEVALLRWRARPLAQAFAIAVADVGGRPHPIGIEDLEHTAEARVAHLLDDRLRGCTASLLLAEHGLPPAISMAVLAGAERHGLRHLHLTRIEPRLFLESYRADPSRIERINERIVSLLEGAGQLEVTSPAGTMLHVRLDPYFPLLHASGRATPGRPENLPSGWVVFHPAGVEGTFVADRGAIGAVRPDPALVRRHPLRVRFAQGRVVSAESESPELTRIVERYLRMHPHAARVGLVALPTNYTIEAETDVEIQDALLPGVNVALGYSNPTHSKAPFRCSVQLRLFGRELDVTAGGVPMVRRGRFVPELLAV